MVNSHLSHHFVDLCCRKDASATSFCLNKQLARMNKMQFAFLQPGQPACCTSIRDDRVGQVRVDAALEGKPWP